MSSVVDLRSDTVTVPTPEMRRAMAEAEVGDDQYGEDPTANELEEAFAERMGMEASVFVPTGVMANQIAIRVLGRPGTTVVAGRRQHLVAYELGAVGPNSGVQLAPVEDADGLLDPADVTWARAAAEHHLPTPGMVAVENTHMAAGGRVWPTGAFAAIVAAAGELPVHVDGARIFNAEVATGRPAASLVEGATTVMACLSKGLCAPIGSMLAGSAPVIEAARLERHRLGGAMRQVGVIAAAGLVGLRTMVERLADDHARAGRLAAAVADRWPRSGLDPERVETNIVVFDHVDPPALLEHLAGAGVRAGTIAPGVVRFVTHHDVDDDGIERAVAALREAP
ncbi:MAG: threonine aldolase family protein [Acidimicrobiales bacterium]